MAADTSVPSGQNPDGGTPAGQVVMHTAEEAARLLKVKPSWLERQAAARKIPFSMLGGSYRFSDRHLAEIVRMNEQAPSIARRDAHHPTRTHRNERNGGESAAVVADLRPRPRNGPRRA